MKPADVIEIRESKGRVRGADLARRYGVCTSTVYAIQNGKAYQWVKDKNTPEPARASVTRPEFFEMVETMVEWEGHAPDDVRAMVSILRKEGLKIVRKVRYEIID